MILRFFTMREVFYLLKIIVLGIFFSCMAFTKNIMLDCKVTLVGIEGKDKASNNTEIIDINLRAKTIFFGAEAIPYKLKNRMRVYEGIYFIKASYSICIARFKFVIFFINAIDSS